MVQVREVLESRYKLGDTVPGTRNCHHFKPTSTTSIKGKHLSDDQVHPVIHSFSVMPKNEIAASLKPNDYAMCIFYGFWWLVLVDLVNLEEKDITCKFMHPHGPTNNLHWSCTDDKGYAPFNMIIMNVETPQSSSNSRHYVIKEEELKHTNSVENLK